MVHAGDKKPRSETRRSSYQVKRLTVQDILKGMECVAQQMAEAIKGD